MKKEVLPDNERSISLVSACMMLICMLVCAALFFSVSVSAAETVSQEEKGSITVTFLDADKNPVSGGNVEIFRIAEVETNGNGAFQYVYTDNFRNQTEDLSKIGDQSFDRILAQKLSADLAGKDGMKAAINSEGTVNFTDIEMGLYLIVQTKAADGYEPISPFLISVPDENGSFMVSAAPKMEEVQKSAGKTPGDGKTPENPKGGILPQTGQLWWPVPILAILGLAFIFAGWGKKTYNK